MRPLFLLLMTLALLVPLGCPSGDDDDAAVVDDDDDATANDDDATANDDDSGSDDDDAADDDDSAQGWPGPGPEGSVVGVVRISVEDEGHGDDDDDDDDDSADDDDGLEGDPVPGLTVTELGTTNTAVTDDSGTFTLIMEDYEPAQIELQVADDLARILVISEAAYRALAAELAVEASSSAHELDLHMELYGGARDSSLGTVDIQFEAPVKGGLAGATATMGGAALGPRVFQDPDTTVAGNTLLAGSERTVLFGNVTPGQQTLTVTSPPGFDCFAPASVLVVADSVTQVIVGCGAQ